MGSEVTEMLYLNTLATVVLDDLARERDRHEQETRNLRALAMPAKRPALTVRQRGPAPARMPRWRISIPWRVGLAKAA